MTGVPQGDTGRVGAGDSDVELTGVADAVRDRGRADFELVSHEFELRHARDSRLRRRSRAYATIPARRSYSPAAAPPDVCSVTGALRSGAG